MIKDKKNLPNSRIKLTISANAAQYRHAFEHELAHIATQTNIPGFRPGKAPAAKVLAQLGRPRIEAEALDHLISDAYSEAIKEADIVPMQGPEVKVETYTAPSEDAKDDFEVVVFTAEVDILPDVLIKNYDKVKIKKEETKPATEDDVDKVIDQLKKQRATLKETEDKDLKLENGMWADLGYEGSVGGVSRADMKNDHHPLMIGEGQLIPGFEDQLIGMKAGEKKTITVTFPKDYQSSELSGKKAEFKVELHELKEVILPEEDVVFAQNFGHGSMKELRAAILESLGQEKQQESRKQQEEDVLAEYMKVSSFEIPQSLVKQEMDRMFQESRERLKGMNFQWETYLEQVKKTPEQLHEEMRPQAEKNVRVGLLLGKVMEIEGITEKDGGGRAALDKLIEKATS